MTRREQFFDLSPDFSRASEITGGIFPCSAAKNVSDKEVSLPVVTRFQAQACRSISWVVAVILSALLAAPCHLGPVKSQATELSSTVPADFTASPISYYFAERYRDALRYGEAVVQNPSTPPALRREAILTTATIYLAQNKESRARQAILMVLSGDPSIDLADPDRFPAPVTRLFYRMRDSVCTVQLGSLVAQKKLLPDLKTIAVGDIENNSIVASRYNLDHLCRGLAQIIAHDLRGATGLKIVDRQRLSVLLDEIGRSKEGMVDPETRVRVGQLSGAQSYLFGQFMQIDEKSARMDLRWVNTATGEHLVSDAIQAKVESAEDIFRLERKLVLEIMAPRIQHMLDSTRAPSDLQRKIEKMLDQRQKSIPRNSYAAWVQASGKALSQEDANDLDGAAQSWNEVHALNPADSTAALRARTITAYRNARSSRS